MQSTQSPRDDATVAVQPITLPRLLAAFTTLPDPRRRHGRRFALSAILALAIVAILANHLSVLAIAQWGKRQSPRVLAALGFADGITPHQSTLHRLLRTLDPLPLAVALTTCIAAPRSADGPSRGSVGVAIDGKAQRGRLVHRDRPDYPVHMLSAVLHERAIVLAQMPLDHTQEKAEAELTAAPTLIARLDWTGAVLTGDALYCQRDLCETITDADGDYLLIVKENQPQLYRDIATLFASRADAALAAASLPPWDMRTATSVDKGHGRLEVRHLVASTALNDYLDWPAVGQVVMIERTWWEHRQRKTAVRYALTSLPPTVADTDRLLVLVRGHWQIENGVHYVKDVTMGEDRSRIRTGHGPSIMAMLRDTVVSVLHRAGWRTIAERLRFYSGDVHAALALLDLPLTENA